MPALEKVSPLFGANIETLSPAEQNLVNSINVNFEHCKEDYIHDLEIEYGLSYDNAETIINRAFAKARTDIKSYNNHITLNEWIDELIITELNQLHKNELRNENIVDHDTTKAREKLDIAIEFAIIALGRQGISRENATLKIKDCFQNALDISETGEEQDLITDAQTKLTRILSRTKGLKIILPPEQ